MKKDLFLKQLLFIDIETVRAEATWETLSLGMQQQWIRKALSLNQHEDLPIPELYRERAGIYAEFGKVICISLGFFYQVEGVWHFKVKAYAHHDEQLLLQEFQTLLIEKFNQGNITFVAHNGKEFDYPYLCRRMLVHQIELPPCLQLSGKKPWGHPHLDTLELWKFGDHKHYTPLALLAEIFNIPSPKDDIDGSQVGRVYYEEKNLQRIARYCNQDVVTTARVFLRLKQLADLEEEHIHSEYELKHLERHTVQQINT
ncbi:3'-5' exonuclease [Algivirga pacifica]|uniref:3'-5' exonuclease n=1 Tax=Algivirga pacifica TaxID=1162670 RepID=UPI0031E64C23